MKINTNIKKIALLALVIVSVSGMSSCKGTTSGESQKIILNVDFHGWAPTINKTPTLDNPRVVQTPQLVADKFMEENPDIVIKWVRNKNVSALEEEMSEWFTTQIATGHCPTIAFSWGTKFQYNDWYVDLTDYLEQPNPYVAGNAKWRDLYENYLFDETNIRGVNGNVYAIPIFLFVGPATGWYYNKTVFADCEITNTPKTWKQFIDVVNTIKRSDFKGTAAAPWSYFKGLQIDQWAMLASLGPAFANHIFTETDYNNDGVVADIEKIRAALDGLYSPTQHQYAKDIYFELKKYYMEVLETGWLTTDYLTPWENGNVAMLEDGTWRMFDELNAKNRTFETGIFSSPIISNDSFSYLPEIEFTENGPYQPGVDFQLNIMKPAVEGKPEVLAAAVKFLQFFSQPEYLSLYAEEWGSSLPATKNSTYSPLLNEWMNQSFPKTPKTGWPQAFVVEQNSRLNRVFAEWLNNRKTNAQFFAAVDEIQRAGALAAIENLKINTEGWNV